MEGEPFPHGLPIAVDGALEAVRFKGGEACFLGLPHGGCGLEEDVAHGLGPRLLVDFDERLDFEQMMGVAKGVVEPPRGSRRGGSGRARRC